LLPSIKIIPMKNLFLSVLTCCVLQGASQEDGSWRLGIQWGLHGNHSEFTGGMENANARFNHNPYGGGAFDLTARYDHSRHWMLTYGLGFSSYGFEFAFSGNYSLLNEDRRYSTVRSEFTVFEIPLMIHYKFNTDCKNRRWVIGAGVVQNLGGSQNTASSLARGTEGGSSAVYMQSEANFNSGGYKMLRFAINRERIFRSGRILQAGLVINAGFREMARANVTYKADGAEYNHEFNNKGNFFGIRIAYYFKSFQKTRD
jgi:hypothetical protein